MYHLEDSLLRVKGIGPQLFAKFEQAGLVSVRDLMLYVPYRYEDRSKISTIAELVAAVASGEKTIGTFQAEVKASSNQFQRGRSTQRATLEDSTGRIQATWFNNPYIVKRMKTHHSYWFSGVVAEFRGKFYITQPTVEDVDKETIHTNRLVPMYSTVQGVPLTVIRKLQKEIVDNLDLSSDQLPMYTECLPLDEALKALHFPDSDELTVQARERLALEEIVGLITHSQNVKKSWQVNHNAVSVPSYGLDIPSSLPFELLASQKRSAKEILLDMGNDHPMNRILIGDVGSGKTIVAGLAMQAAVKAGYHAALVAPTQILATQHAKTLGNFFPELKIELVTSTQKPENLDKPSLLIGTHAVLNLLKSVTSPVALLVFDEQHRFGVAQRSELHHLNTDPHVLTMTATPIPRSFMLTMFSHLALSTIDELPKNRLPTKTWLLNEPKRKSMYEWLSEQIISTKSSSLRRQGSSKLDPIASPSATLQDDNNGTSNFQVIVVCPFIDPSHAQSLENVAAVNEKFVEIKKTFQSLGKSHNQQMKIDLLHSRLKKTDKAEIIARLFAKDIDVLVTTPIVEVGVDLPQASAIVIEAAERFGLASLHQLRGRVGRAGQQGYCLLFPTKGKGRGADTKQRLKAFCEINNGLELAEMDLKHRGAGDLFGTSQHGFDDLQFASWTDLTLIHKAKEVVEEFNKKDLEYRSPILRSLESEKTVLAN